MTDYPVETPFFSVIIPCYNAVDSIGITLNALENQTFTHFEIICVDDCSQDATCEYLIQKAKKSKIPMKVYSNEKNQGPGRSRDVGLKYAVGEYIGFCDSDDYFEDKALELLHQKLSAESLDLVFFDFYRCYHDGSRTVMKNTTYFNLSMTKEDYVALATESLWSIIVKRSLFSKVVIPNLYNSEDGPLVTILTSVANRISFLPVPLYNYCYRENSLSTKVELRVIDEFWKAFIYLREYTNNSYKIAFEFHCIKTVLYGLLYNAIRCKKNSSFLSEKLSDFQKMYPIWYNNKYLKYLPLRKSFWFFFVKMRCFWLLRLYCKAHYLYIKLKLKL